MRIRTRSIIPLRRVLSEQHHVIYAARHEDPLEELLIAQPEQRTSRLYDFIHGFLSKDNLSRLYHKADNFPGESVQKAKRAVERELTKPKEQYGVVHTRYDE